MKTVYKGMVSALTAAILLSLCLTPIAFATEEPSAATLSDAEEAELPAATPSDAEEVELLTATPSNAVADTVFTGEELMEWLSGHKDTGGTVELADDISISDFYYARNMRAEAVIIDTGEFTISVNGYVYLQATSPLTIRGAGGEQGLLRTSGTGSMLHLNGLDLKAEDGYAVFQEEGTGFILDTLENTSVAGTVHYAEQPFVWEWEPALAVVKPGETLDDKMLPAAISACINHNGTNIYPYEDVPVTWDLSGHGEDQKLRRRFAVTGEFEGMASQTAPGCTVVYDDFPLTFLEVNAVKMEGTYGDTYRLRGTFSKPEDRLPITVAQEYSFDGKNWTLYQEKTVTTLSSGFSITLFAGTEDLERYSELFIRLSWNDDGTMYYSNILGFAMDSLEVNEEPGGNRGGGTDIVDPPKQPEPDPEPETTPPEASEPETKPPPVTSDPPPGQPGNSGTDHESDGDGATSSTGSSGGSHGDGKEPAHGITQKSDLPGGSLDYEAAPPITVPESTSVPGLVSEPVLPNKTVVSSSAVKDEPKKPSAAAEPTPSRASSAPVSEAPESTAQISAANSDMKEAAEALAETEAEPPVQEPDILPVVAGFAAVAVSIGGAALYLHPQAWKRLLGKLRNRIRR
ncbi:hypothetical protein G5A97_03715 [[Clostridium] symbiosum]|uniref:hypothetical protein n=1 Tax=Clostridium symbiosum TaxID=1512 RepID=UPI00156EAA08|nr:hypothetical protein [[Clostridium] symbiosum]NSI94405.1 hypothetical protein [[Clostridium] symbiosum]